MKKVVDEAVQQWKEDGGWQEAYDKWIGQYTNENQQPPTMPLQEALDMSK